MSTRRKRNSDGRLRPAELRYRARAKWRAIQQYENDPANADWLAQFDPGARDRFFRHANINQARWLRRSAAKLGVSEEQASLMLEKIAEEKRWMKLRTSSGMVVGIAPPRHQK